MKQFLKEIKYGFYIALHPFKGFWDTKREGDGSVRAATFYLVTYAVLTILSGYMTGYLFNPNEPGEFQALKQLFMVLGLFFCYCIANWGLTCLFEGEGTFKDIYRATGYVLVPLVLAQVLLIPISNYFILSESAFYTTINTFSLIWAGFLLLASVLQTHNYTLQKGLLMILAIVFGMCVIAYVALLFFNLLQQMFGFVMTLITEFSARFL